MVSLGRLLFSTICGWYGLAQPTVNALQSPSKSFAVKWLAGYASLSASPHTVLQVVEAGKRSKKEEEEFQTRLRDHLRRMNEQEMTALQNQFNVQSMRNLAKKRGFQIIDEMSNSSLDRGIDRTYVLKLGLNS